MNVRTRNDENCLLRGGKGGGEGGRRWMREGEKQGREERRGWLKLKSLAPVLLTFISCFWEGTMHRGRGKGRGGGGRKKQSIDRKGREG